MAKVVEWRWTRRGEWDWELMGVIHVLTAKQGGCSEEQPWGGTVMRAGVDRSGWGRRMQPGDAAGRLVVPQGGLLRSWVVRTRREGKPGSPHRCTVPPPTTRGRLQRQLADEKERLRN